MKISKLSDILSDFKRVCRLRGWETSENDDWVKLNDEYDNFMSARSVSPHSFKAISSNRKCVVRKGPLYTVVEPSHSAWLFSEAPSEDLTGIVIGNPEFSKKIAIFDFSSLLERKTCARLNNTDSAVFQEFEKFLQNELKAKLETLRSSSGSNAEAATEVAA